MSSMQGADHEAALSRELDRWLSGDRSRRHVLAGLLGLGAGMLAARAAHAATAQRLGRPVDNLHQAAVELASPDTPLGQAQVDAVKASTEGPKDGSAFRAVEAAKRFKGVTLGMTYEAGLQALEPRNYSGPQWQDLTGIASNVIELSHPDQYSKPIAEHIAQSGAYDVLDIEPAWIPSLADGGVIAPIDEYVAKYMNQADLEDYHPLYKFLPTYKGKRWGFFDDGDMLALYYRKDIFEDPKLGAAYKAKYNRDLAVPKTWDDYAEVAQFITDQMAPKVYGAAHFRKAGSPGNQYGFLQEYRANGGRLFDAKTMKAQLASDAGLRTLQQMVAQNKASIPGNNDFDAVAAWAAWLQGKVAMLYSWPPTGRMSENYSQRAKAINFVPTSAIVGKVGYAVMPGGAPEMASGYVKALTAEFAEQGRRLSVHAMDNLSGDFAGTRHAALYAARSVPHVALHIAALSVALADREGLPGHPVRFGECRRGGYDHAGLAGLRPDARPYVYRRLGRRGPEAGADQGGGGMGRDHPENRRRFPARGL